MGYPNLPTVTAAEYNELFAEAEALRARVSALEAELEARPAPAALPDAPDSSHLIALGFAGKLALMCRYALQAPRNTKTITMVFTQDELERVYDTLLAAAQKEGK